MGRKDSLPDDAPAPRLCELVKWPHFQGYGFNLHSEKGKEGQFIGKVDPESPAEACGLQEGDQIIEVNGVNTSNENHKQVVERIKTHSDRASLLVVDAKAAEYYKKRNILVNGTMSNVKHMKSAPAEKTKEADTSSKSESTTEDSAQATSQGDGGDEPPPPVPPKTELASEDNSSAASAADEPDSAKAASEPEEKPEEAKPVEDKAPDESPAEKQEERAEESKPEEATSVEKKTEEEKPAEEKSGDKSPAPSEGSQDRKSEKPAEKAAPKEANGTKDLSPTIDTSLQVESGSDRTQPSPAPSAGSTSTVESAKSAESGSTAAEGDKFGLKLNMTAAEMREYLKSKKRPDPRKDNLSFKQRHEIVQNM